jgi:predicted ATPase/DNA-binding winged helix-turn-helix (wHTH) protein
MKTEFRFGDFRLLVADRRLVRGPDELPLTSRAFGVLVFLVERAGQLVGKDELLQQVWAGVVVEENNLAVQVGVLRKVLGAAAIATVAGSGYRFMLPVTSLVQPTGAENNLPAAAAPLVGRDEERQALQQWLQGQRLVTVVGAGGIGKSSLALAVGRELACQGRDGVWWVELAGLADPTLLTASLAQTLGINLAERNAGPGALAAALASREALLIIDNCEHLLEAVAELVQALLQAAPGLRVLATSQEPLRLSAEQQYRLNPLAVPRDAATPDARAFGALALLVARVRAAAPNFVLSDDDLTIAINLCRRLDGLPLAIELAAARIPLLGLRTVHDRLHERFKLLTAGSRTALRRHQTLRAAMAWSHGLLDDGQRALFMRLGVFSGGFTLALAQAQCVEGPTDEWAVLDQLAMLVAKSLVVLDPARIQRYRLLESARAFALEQLAAAGETPRCLQRHAQTMLQFLKRVDDANMDGQLRTDEYAALVLPELDNLRAAYAWADGPDGDRAIAIDLAAHVSPLVDYSLEFAGWMLAQRGPIETMLADAATAARFWRGLAASNMYGFAPTAELLAAALRSAGLYRQLGWPKRVFSALRRVTIWALRTRDYALARASIDESRQLLQADWAPEFQIALQRGYGYLAELTGDLDRAHWAYQEGVRLARDVLGDWRLECISLVDLAELHWLAGRHAQSSALLHDLVQRMQVRPASDFELVDALETWLLVVSETDDRQATLDVARQALPALRRMPRFSLGGCAHVLLVLGRAEDAARVLGAYAAGASAGVESDELGRGRLLAAARIGVAAALLPADQTALQSAGQRLRRADICALLERAVAVWPGS